MKKLIFFPGKANKKREEIESFGSSVIRYVPVERILPNPFHSRKNCDGEAIIRLADSIKRYGIIAVDAQQPYDTLTEMAKKRGFLAGRNEYDTLRMARTFLDEFRAGKLGRITLELPPEA